MRTTALKSEPSHDLKSTSSTTPVRTFPGISNEMISILYLQRTIGNQALRRLLQDGVKEAAINSNSTGSISDTYRFSQVSPMVQRNGAAAAAILAIERQRRAERNYTNFINSAEQYGMPVRFMRRVARSYTIRFGSSDQVNPVFNEMSLEEETLDSVENMAPTLPIGESSGIRTIYEESVHAYLDLVEDEPRFREFITAGERHYQGAPVDRNRITSSPSRLFNEAAANYAAHRVSSWWSAFENLSIYIAMAAENPETARRIQEQRSIEKVRDDYNRAMGELVFGYSEEGGFLGFGTEQAYTSRPLSSEMKTFLDQEILEGKIPDSFDQVAGFQRMLSEAGIQLGQRRDIRRMD